MLGTPSAQFFINWVSLSMNQVVARSNHSLDTSLKLYTVAVEQ